MSKCKFHRVLLKSYEPRVSASCAYPKIVKLPNTPPARKAKKRLSLMVLRIPDAAGVVCACESAMT